MLSTQGLVLPVHVGFCIPSPWVAMANIRVAQLYGERVFGAIREQPDVVRTNADKLAVGCGWPDDRGMEGLTMVSRSPGQETALTGHPVEDDAAGIEVHSVWRERGSLSREADGGAPDWTTPHWSWGKGVCPPEPAMSEPFIPVHGVWGFSQGWVVPPTPVSFCVAAARGLKGSPESLLEVVLTSCLAAEAETGAAVGIA
jgi:hypothetical protein